MNRLVITAIIVGLWVAFVVYCLINGSKIQVPIKSNRTFYWITSAITVDIAIYLINGISVVSIILIIINTLATSLYISIPSGYNSNGIFIRGFLFPFKKIEDMGIEHVLHTNRLNFKCFHRIFYIDSDSYQLLRQCEALFKKEKYHD